jgi:hypothetical protein
MSFGRATFGVRAIILDICSAAMGIDQAINPTRGKTTLPTAHSATEWTASLRLLGWRSKSKSPSAGEAPGPTWGYCVVGIDHGLIIRRLELRSKKTLLKRICKWARKKRPQPRGVRPGPFRRDMCRGGPTHEIPTNLAEIVPEIGGLLEGCNRGTRKPELCFAFSSYTSGEGLRDGR